MKGFLSLIDEYYQQFKTTEDLPPQPPPGSFDEEGIFTTYYHDTEEADQWNRIAMRHNVVQTSLCDTFSFASGLKSLLEK